MENLEERIKKIEEELKEIKKEIEKDENGLKVGDKVFINFTCKSGECSTDGVCLASEMLENNHKIASINHYSEFLKTYSLDIDTETWWKYSKEWLIKVEE